MRHVDGVKQFVSISYSSCELYLKTNLIGPQIDHSLSINERDTDIEVRSTYTSMDADIGELLSITSCHIVESL